MIQSVQNFSEISEMLQKIEKKIFLSEMVAPELVLLNFPYEEQLTFHRQPLR